MNAAPPTAWMRIIFPAPGFFANDPRFTIQVDGWTAYDGSFRSGVDVRFPIQPGPHALTTRIEILGMGRTKAYQVVAAHGYAVEVTLDYSRLWGNLTASPKINNVALA